jgi:hypothetical protein
VLRLFPFDQSIEGYGYEDLELAQRIHRANHRVIHIDNAVLHRGLKNTKVFMSDINHSIENLIELYEKGKIKESRLIKMYYLIRSAGLQKIVYPILSIKNKYIEKKLFTADPKLIFLDLYKLYYFDKVLKSRSK